MATPVITENLNMNLPRLTIAEFQKVASIIYTHCGINLEQSKKVMVESRLNKRLRTLNKSSFESYIQYITSKEGVENELVHMIDVVTTNKTDFFREPHHFEFLKNTLLPEFIKSHDRPFRVWSSACSSGEEAYTLAMVLQSFAKERGGFNYNILASDISTQVLQKASTGIYNMERIEDIPQALRQQYLLKSKDTSNPKVRIVPALREKVNFMRINLMDDSWEIDATQDVIFCRNVLIYFDRETQYKVVQNLIKKLRPGGILFIGHSESLHFFDLPIKQIRPTIFIKH